MTILIVDDNEQNRYQLEVLLRANGHQTVSAANGREALEAARRDPPGLIISDILMPVMDGFALCREWKSDERLRRIPFVFYTATYTDERDREFALGLGADRFLVKPEEPEVFLQAILEVMQHIQNRPAAPADSPLASPEAKEPVFLQQYNEALIRKLEAKMNQLEKVNHELERENADRRLAEEALRESEQRFRTLVESAPEGIFVQSGGRFVYLNQAMLRLVGAARPEDLLGTEFVERIAPGYREAVDARIRLQSETGMPVPLMEQEYLRLDGSRVPVETTAMPVRYEGSDAHMVFIRDITERKEVEAKQVRLETQLRQAQKLEAIGRLAGGVAHDFNNILTVILGYAETLLLAQKDDDPHRRPVDEIRLAAKRAAGLTRQLLAFSRHQILEPRVLDLGEVVRNLEPMLRRLIGEDIDLRTVLPEGLGRMKADPGQIDQVLMNLAVNARDAMERGGTLTLEAGNVDLDPDDASSQPQVKPGAYVMLAVTDSGTGMPPNVQRRLFEPFFTTKEKGKGTGLGLSTVYGIVKQSGGHIAVYSEPGHGTAFKIYFPRVLEAVEPIARARVPSVPSRGTETILVAEDEDGVRKLVRMVLQENGYLVLEAEDGAKALEACEHHAGPLHLLISDVVMPKMGGKQLAERLRTLRPSLKILFTSGYTDDAIAHQGVLDPGVAFLQKPYYLKDLLAKVREVLDAPMR